MEQATETEGDTAGPEPERQRSGSSSRWLRNQARPEHGLLLLATLAGLFAAWITIAQAGLLAGIIHGLVVDGIRRDALIHWFALLLASIPLRALCQAAKDHLALGAALRIRTRLRNHLARRIMALGPVGAASMGSGRLTSTLIEQVDALEGYHARFLPQLRLSVLIPLSVLAVVFWLDWLAALLLLFATPLIPLFMALVGMGAGELHRRQFQSLERLSAFFLDRLQGLETLRHLGRGRDTLHSLSDNAEEYRRRTMAVLRVAFLSSAVLEFFSSVAIAMTAIYIGLGLLGYLTLGPAPGLTLFSGLFILILAPEVFAPLRELAQHYHDRAAALGAADGIREVLTASPPTLSRNGAGRFGNQAPTVVLDAVCAGYGDGKPDVLNTISATFPAGETTLLVGPSGSGKSTLLMVIMGMLDPRHGRVLVDGTAVPDYAEGELEAHMGWLGQTPHLLPGTLAANIRMACPDADADALCGAARDAGVLRFADHLPDGLETWVGERAIGISGGEAQRVALARVLLRAPPLVLLDEPTASLDPESRRILLDALERRHRQSTLIIATHQPDQFPWADHRLTLDRGRLREDSRG